jgi:succinoglycan biosynthesis transport protein ExoP
LQLHNKQLHAFSLDDDNNQSQSEGFLDIEAIVAIARRQLFVVATCIVLGIIMGAVNIVTAVPLFTSNVSVLIDRGNGQLADQLSSLGSGSMIDDEASVLSQVEIFKSDTIASAVVDKLGLASDPAFMASPGSLIGNVIGIVRSVLSVSEWFVSKDARREDLAARHLAAERRLLDNLEVSRVGRTYVLDIKYTSPSPELSAKIANAFGDIYLVDKLNSKYDATRRASDWLQDRIAELRQKSLDSDLAVQKFRTANNLVSAGSVLVSDQQLSELNSALIVAQSDTAKAEARLQRIQQIIASGQSDAIVTDVLGSSISNELRQKYLDASKREAQISARLGSNHVQAVRMRSEMSEYQRLMFEELNRIAESYKSDLDVSKAREKSLLDSVAQATGVSATANETQVQLRELEREAETYKNLYQTFLQRYQEAVQQQSFPVTEARVITRANPSDVPSHPRKPLIMALFLIMGAAWGCGVGAFREIRDRFFRTGDQVRDVLHLEFLGTMPLIPSKRMPSPEGGSPSKTEMFKTSSVSDYVIDHPLSPFAETLRSAKLAADFGLAGKDCKIIGVVSSLPGEGKSMTSINLAELLADQGNRTILIDCDLRNPGATRAAGSHVEAGLLEALLEDRDPRSLLLHNPKTGLALLPAVIKHRVPHSSELLASSAMRKVLTTLSSEADYIILDLPPLGPVVDARAIAGRVDGFIMVVEWGRTARRVVRQLLAGETEVKEKCLGVILNKVDQKKMKLYRSYGSSEYYHSQYTKYYQDVT